MCSLLLLTKQSLARSLHLPDDDDDDICESDGLFTIIAACQIDDAGHIGCSGCIEGEGKGARQPPTLAAGVIKQLDIQLVGTYDIYS